MIIPVCCRVFAFLLPGDDVGFGPSSGLFVFDPLLKSGLRAAFLLASCEGATSVIDAVDGSSTGTCVPWMWVKASHDSEERVMQTIATIGLDIAKSVFQVHVVDAGGQVIVRRQLKRRYVLTFFQKLSSCLVGIEACGSPSTGSYRAVDAAGLCETPRQAAEERCD